MYASWNARAVGLGLTADETVEIAAQAGFDGGRSAGSRPR